MSQARRMQVQSMIAMNTITGNRLNVRAMNTIVSFGSLIAQLDGFGSLGPQINSVINSAMPAHLAHPDTVARMNSKISEVAIPIFNVAFNQMTMTDLIV